MPQALLFVLGAIGAAIAAKLIAGEWQRVNEELDRARGEPATAKAARDGMPNLRRDPVTGDYRPNR
ncbi:MAG TPA: hypothetical protein VD863_16855 [Bradyrhizobium sp.]|nr:hypothetical protein [Bradyrhizobium sp.]